MLVALPVFQIVHTQAVERLTDGVQDVGSMTRQISNAPGIALFARFQEETGGACSFAQLFDRDRLITVAMPCAAAALAVKPGMRFAMTAGTQLFNCGLDRK